jgi:hypothetical protein
MRTKTDHPLTIIGDATRDRHDDAALWLKKNDPKIKKAAKKRRLRERRRERLKARSGPGGTDQHSDSE